MNPDDADKIEALKEKTQATYVVPTGRVVVPTGSEYVIQVQYYKNSLKTLEKQKRVLQRNQLTLEDKINVLSIELENTSNLLKHSERINADVETAKKELQTKLDNHLVQTEKYRLSSKNLFRLIDSRPLFNRFAKTDSMNVVPPPLSGDYTSLSDHIDLDESQMFYGIKSSTSSDSKSMSNDFVSCDDSDESLEVNTNDFASSDSSVKYSEPKPNDSTSCASTSSDLPSFSCNSFDKNENTSRTSCNKNGYFNKNAGHFRKNASSVSKLCFVYGSGTHLIKDFDFYEKQMVNKTVGIGVGIVHSKNKKNPFPDAEDEGVFDSGCYRSRITGKGTIRTPTLDFKNVYYVKELQQFNLFSISQICNKKNRVLFTDTKCLVLSKDFKLSDESMVVLRVPRKHNLYTINLNNLYPRVSTLHCDHHSAQNLNPSSTSSMAALRYRDEHNKVGYLLIPTGSDDYHQIIDFLRASHIRYALTHNPIIFDSLVKQFCSTATLKSPELGPPAILATIDKTPYTITEDLVRSQIQLADDGGIDDLPIAEIYYGMDNLEYVTEVKLTFFKNKFSPQWRFLVHTLLHCLSTKSGSWDQFGSPLAVALICLSDERRFNWSSYIFRRWLNFEGPPMPLLAAMLAQAQEGDGAGKVYSLEIELKDHKKLFKDVVGNYAVDSNIPSGGASDTPAPSIGVPADVPTSANVPTGSPSVPADVPLSVAPAGVSNKGKPLMVEEDIHVKERTFKQMQEDILGEEAAKRLHDEEQAQVDRQRAELQRRRQQEVLGSTMYYTKADWIHIMAQVEANASLSKTLLGDDVSEDNFLARMAALIKRKKQALAKKLAHERRNSPMTQGQQGTYMRQFDFKRTGPVFEEPSSKRKKSTDAPIPSVPEVPQSPVISSPASSGTRRKSLGRKRGQGSFVWQNQHLWEIGSWRLYTLSNVHVLETVSGEVVYMFANVSYPFSVKLMEMMLKHKLEINKDVVGNDMTTAEQLIQFIKNQLAAAQVSHA
uniref:Ribonuclease H-like domain-containing protein n=1 Tax=Tanacetum cinerariifolium TaxID=118510 RepID=A0A6L2M1J7_TANCI|nr:ribonuclease H-like domain-containing protein [Tanacetum cinerariifolium]